MKILANLSIQTKVTLALAPLVALVLAATLFSTLQMHRIDRRYSNLIDRENLAVGPVLDFPGADGITLHAQQPRPGGQLHADLPQLALGDLII